MDMLWGAALFGAWTLIFTLIVLALRHPDAPLWQRNEVLQNTIAIASVGIWTIAAGLMLNAAVAGTNWVEIAGTAAVAAATIAALWALRPLRRLRAYDAARATEGAPVTPLPVAPQPAMPAAGRKAA